MQSSIATLKPGTAVLCQYRVPTANQYWVGGCWIGIVEQPTDNPALWNGHNSERAFCEGCGRTRVRYPFGVMHDSTKSLIPVELVARAVEGMSGASRS